MLDVVKISTQKLLFQGTQNARESGSWYIPLYISIGVIVKRVFCTQSYLIWMIFKKRSVWSQNGTLTGTITPNQSRRKSNRNQKVLHTPKRSRTGASPSNEV